MSLVSIFSEIWRMIKENWVKVLVGAVICSVLTIGLQIFISQYASRLFSDPAEEDLSIPRDFLIEIYSQDPAEFQFYAQKEDGDLFINSFLFDEYFSSTEVVAQIEEETGVKVSEVLEAEESLGLIKGSKYRGSIAAIRDGSSSIITFRVQVGKNAEENLAVAKWIEEEVEKNILPFSGTLNTVVLQPATIGELIQGEDALMVSSVEAIAKESMAPATSRTANKVVYGVLGFILGLILVPVLFVIRRMLAKDIRYAFEYGWDFSDQHFILNSKDDNYEVLYQQIVSTPKDASRLFLQDPASSLEGVDSQDTVEPGQDVDEVIILVQSGETSKTWYRHNSKLMDAYQAHKKIIQIY